MYGLDRLATLSPEPHGHTDSSTGQRATPCRAGPPAPSHTCHTHPSSCCWSGSTDSDVTWARLTGPRVAAQHVPGQGIVIVGVVHHHPLWQILTGFRCAA
jgi:hypothetical protein